MSTSLFLTCSFLAVGLCGLLLWQVRRQTVAAGETVPPLGLGKWAIMLALCFFTSAMLIRTVGELFFGASMPGWTRLLVGPLMVSVALTHLADDMPGGMGLPARRLFGALILALGVLVLVMETYHYAISLGTARAVSL